MIVAAPAKLNLFLHITGQRPDGYHLLQTVFQFVDYGDELEFAVRDDGEIHRLSELAGVAPEQDLVVRAARSLQQASGTLLGADIRVTKNLPMGGGLGGGSSDAATVLLALNKLWGIGFDLDRLAEIGLALGADVPVFVRGQACWAEGVGDIITAIQIDEPWYVVLSPAVEVNTAKLFSHSGLTRDCSPCKIRDLETGQSNTAFANVFQPLVREMYAEVDQALNYLSQFAEAKLTGTGACVFGAFENEKMAREAFANRPQEIAGFVAKGLNKSSAHANL